MELRIFRPPSRSLARARSKQGMTVNKKFIKDKITNYAHSLLTFRKRSRMLKALPSREPEHVLLCGFLSCSWKKRDNVMLSTLLNQKLNKNGWFYYSLKSLFFSGPLFPTIEISTDVLSSVNANHFFFLPSLSFWTTFLLICFVLMFFFSLHENSLSWSVRISIESLREVFFLSIIVIHSRFFSLSLSRWLFEHTFPPMSCHVSENANSGK